MANKKDDAIQAQHEAEIAELQNTFLKLPLAAKDFSDEGIDDDFSPAIVIDESSEPLAPPKAAKPHIVQEPVDSAVSMNSETQPEPAKSTPPKESLGAAEFLLSGLMPSEPSATQDVKTESSEQTEPPAPIAAPQDESPKVSSETTENLETEASIESSSTHSPASPAVNQQPPEEPLEEVKNQQPKQHDDDLDSPEPKEEKKGMFSKAKSLFSISKKDKKDES